jgi:lysophospholipase L1-like esterase
MRLTLSVLAALLIAVYAVPGTLAAEPKAGKPAKPAATTQAAANDSSTVPAEAKTNGSKEDPYKWWRGNCARIASDLKKMDGKVDIGFIGDSITARWRGGENWTKHWGAYRAVNMGIGGDRTQNVLWRLQNGELDGYKARLYVVMIGTNNCWGKNVDPAEVAAGVKAILDLVQAKQPQAKILLLSIFPCGEKPNLGRELRTSVNQLISKFAGGQVHYMDISAKFLEPDGAISKEVMPDSLHLGSKGFDIWADAIKDKVKELLGESKQPPSP